MPTVTKCPECLQPMKLSDAAAGKRARCPGCKHVFVAPGGEEEPEVVECAVVEEPKRPAKRPSRDEDDEDDRPRRKARRDEEDDDEEDRPRRRKRDDDEEDRPAKRRRKRSERDASAPSGPLILGILSCVFCCMPLIGAILGNMAKNKADDEMNRLPSGRRYEAAHRQMQTARLLGNIGVGLSVLMAVVGLVVRIATWNR